MSGARGTSAKRMEGQQRVGTHPFVPSLLRKRGKRSCQVRDYKFSGDEESRYQKVTLSLKGERLGFAGI
jgi:hypothetical protein